MADATETALTPDIAASMAMIRGELAALRGNANGFRAGADESARVLEGEDLLNPQSGGVRIHRAEGFLALGEPRAALEVLADVTGGGNDLLLAMVRSIAAANLGDDEAHAAIGTTFEFPDQVSWTKGLRRKLAATDAALASRWEEARMAYGEAMATFRAQEAHLWEAYIGLEFDAFLGAASEDARRAGEEAAEFFTSRGAGGVVDRYRAAFQGTPAPAAIGTRAATATIALDTASEVEAR